MTRRLFARVYAAREWVLDREHRLPVCVVALVDVVYDVVSGVRVRDLWREHRDATGGQVA